MQAGWHLRKKMDLQGGKKEKDPSGISNGTPRDRRRRPLEAEPPSS